MSLEGAIRRFCSRSESESPDNPPPHLPRTSARHNRSCRYCAHVLRDVAGHWICEYPALPDGIVDQHQNRDDCTGFEREPGSDDDIGQAVEMVE